MPLREPQAEPGAASLVSPRNIVHSGLCIGCGGCAGLAPNSSLRMKLDDYGQYKPQGAPTFLGRPSPEFSATCPFSPSSLNEDEIAARRFPDAPHRDERIGRHEAAFVGHVEEQDFRLRGSSGGMVTWVAAELLRRGLVDGVAHVAARHDDAENRKFFGYGISRSEVAVRQGAKSRYYPVELSGVLEEIRAVPGRYAVVGIPCFIKAVHLRCAQDPVLRERIAFTLGLFCGHMKSARMVESFAWQMGSRIDEVEAIDYRLKLTDRPANWYRAQLRQRDGSTREQDWWHLVDGDWGSGFFQNSACNFCDDVVAETADISFGDAWVEPYSSDGRGTNVVVVRSRLLHSLLREAIADHRLALQDVDSDFIVGTQAAGFRQRREGLAYRLTWPRLGIRPRKRVAPRRHGIKLRRKLIYRMRCHISAWSHRVFWLARRTNRPCLYLGWGRTALAVYHGLAYSRGKLGKIIERLGLQGRDA